MKFKHGTRRRALEYEKDWVQRWKADKTFEKSVENRPKDDSYVFYDGPPFITGVPHHGTLLTSMVKDAVPRYQTMKGKRVERVWGWDTHGLPAEVFTEKKLGIKDRRDIGTKISLEEYITTARENMVQTGSLWQDTIDRIGRWVDFEGAYKTMDKDYMESVWWAFKTLHDKGKIYEGERVLMYCTRDATPLSKAEVTMDAGAYQDVTDPSVYVKFKLKGEPKKAHKLKKDAKVLFVCYANVARSQMAKAVYNTLTNSQNAKSAGVGVNDVHPDGTTIAKRNTIVAQEIGQDKYESSAEAVLRDSYNIDISDWERTQLTPEALEEYDLVVNIAEKFQTPDWFRGDNVVWWDVKDPGLLKAGEQRDKAAKSSLTIIENRIKDLLKGSVVDDDIDAKYLLAWTTTPWTLPANTALAVNSDVDYVEVKHDDEVFIVAKDLVEKVFTDEKHQPLEYEIVRELKGSELVGLSYEPLFVDRGENAHKIWHADYVETEAGTGIVHLAPAYGEEDFLLASANNIPVVHVIDENGLYTEGDWVGENVWEINKPIAKELHERGTVWKIDYYRHSYPHCHRCNTRLMYRAHPSWFMDIDGQRTQMLEGNAEVNWFPEHIKHGRSEKTIETAPDWNLSRDRFWATAMPVWEGTDANGKKHQIIVGSYAELKELSGVELDDYHRPWIDEVEFDKDGVHYKRIDKVIDCWFESGSMPFAQFHYPFENKEKFEASFPGDFIVEYVPQVRAWFYYMNAVNVGLFDQVPFKTALVHGTMMGTDGRKLSKSYGNYTDPNELMDKFSADSLRFLLLSSPLLNGEDFALHDKDVGDVARKLGMVWNMYDFFTMYAEVDGWEYNLQKSPEVRGEPYTGVGIDELENPLDVWIVSRVHQLVAEVEKHMDGYNIPDAMTPILPFLDDASNWYVRRSRRRFWKSEDDADKNDAYKTLHYVLVRLSYVLAPFTPFLAEELYHNLTGDDESIHLKDWWPAGDVNELVVNEMETVREYVNEGLSLRAKAGLKVRQPLARFVIPSFGKAVDYEDILTEELNVKTIQAISTVSEIRHSGLDPESSEGSAASAWILNRVQDDGAGNQDDKGVALDTTITPELKREGLMREVIRHVQAARKGAGLQVDDRIVLQLTTSDDELQKAIDEHADTIAAETLATLGDTADNQSAVVVDGYELAISLQKQ